MKKINSPVHASVGNKKETVSEQQKQINKTKRKDEQFNEIF